VNQRERLLSILVGAAAVVLVMWYVTSSVFARFEEKDRRIESLSKEVRKKKDEVRKAQLAATRVANYTDRSLPPDADLASSLYQAWLTRLIEQVGLTDTEVTKLRVAQARNTYQRIGFNISAQGNLSQLVEFLYQFQSMDWMHRIDRFSVKPIRNSKQLSLDLTISGLCINGAPRSEQLTIRTAPQWQEKSLAEYREPIVQRNFFSPPNAEPALNVPARSTAYVGKTFELPLQASDPDPLDRVTFALAKNVDPPAKIDSSSGKLTWSPSAVGDYTLEIVASDDGIPSKSKVHTLYVSVQEPPPPVVAAPAKPAFDLAKYTILTAVLGVNERAEMWLLVQPTGETRRLQTGDEFEIGSIKGEVSEIGVDYGVVVVDGKLHRLTKGETLLNAVTPID
jgi:Tfp pilus assembly protein PilO